MCLRTLGAMEARGAGRSAPKVASRTYIREINRFRNGGITGLHDSDTHRPARSSVAPNARRLQGTRSPPHSSLRCVCIHPPEETRQKQRVLAVHKRNLASRTLVRSSTQYYSSSSRTHHCQRPVTLRPIHPYHRITIPPLPSPLLPTTTNNETPSFYHACSCRGGSPKLRPQR